MHNKQTVAMRRWHIVSTAEALWHVLLGLNWKTVKRNVLLYCPAYSGHIIMTYVTAAVFGLSELSVNVCSEPKLRASAARLKLIHT